MARYKPMHQGLKLLALDFDRQILRGTFEYALRHVLVKSHLTPLFETTQTQWAINRH